MTILDYFGIAQGTAIVWGVSGASGVTHALNFDNLLDATAQQGVYADLGATQWEEEWAVFFAIETGTAPTAGNTISSYLVCNYQTSNWPGKVDGTDSAYTLGTNDANLRLIGEPPVVTLVATNDANTVLRRPPVIWRPAARYVAPVIDNNLGVGVRDEATATNNDSRLVIVPRRLLRYS